MLNPRSPRSCRRGPAAPLSIGSSRSAASPRIRTAGNPHRHVRRLLPVATQRPRREGQRVPPVHRVRQDNRGVHPRVPDHGPAGPTSTAGSRRGHTTTRTRSGAARPRSSSTTSRSSTTGGLLSNGWMAHALPPGVGQLLLWITPAPLTYRSGRVQTHSPPRSPTRPREGCNHGAMNIIPRSRSGRRRSIFHALWGESVVACSLIARRR